MSKENSTTEISKVTLPEVIDERIDLDRLFGKPKGQLNLHFGEVKRITSMGIRAFKMSLDRLKAEKVSIVLVEVTPPIIEAMDFISNLIPLGSRIESVLLPYSCRECKNDFMVLHPFQDLSTKQTELESAPCTLCGKASEFDHLKEIYFKPWPKHYF